MIKEVYGIYEGSIYEDGSVGSVVYRGKGRALSILKERVEELQAEQDQVYKDEELYFPVPYKWTEKEKGYWTNGLEVVKLIEFEVK